MVTHTNKMVLIARIKLLTSLYHMYSHTKMGTQHSSLDAWLASDGHVSTTARISSHHGSHILASNRGITRVIHGNYDI